MRVNCNLANNLLCKCDQWTWHYHLIFIINRYSIFKTSPFYIVGLIFLRLWHFFIRQKLEKSSSSSGFRKNKSRPNFTHKQIRVFFSLTSALLSELWLISPKKANLISLCLSLNRSLSCHAFWLLVLCFCFSTPKSTQTFSSGPVPNPSGFWLATTLATGQK